MKSMKDILQQQLDYVDKTRNVKPLLQTVGYHFSKFNIIILYMDMIGEFVCRVRKAEAITFKLDIESFLSSFVEIFKRVNQSMSTCNATYQIVIENTATNDENEEEDDDGLATPATMNDDHVPLGCRTPPRPDNDNGSKRQKTSHSSN